MFFYHYTNTIFAIKDILIPQIDGYCHWPENLPMESLIERFRPKNKLSRPQSVFVTDTSCSGLHFGAGGDNFELLVKADPNTDSQRSDLQWLSPIDQGYENIDDIYQEFSEKQIAEIAKGYWSGKGFNKKPKFEYRTRKAIVKAIKMRNK